MKVGKIMVWVLSNQHGLFLRLTHIDMLQDRAACEIIFNLKPVIINKLLLLKNYSVKISIDNFTDSYQLILVEITSIK